VFSQSQKKNIHAEQQSGSVGINIVLSPFALREPSQASKGVFPSFKQFSLEYISSKYVFYL
jgi:hypothetical protein